MKRLIAILFTFLSIQLSAQTLQGPSGYGKKETRFKALDFLGIPYKDTICDLVENTTNGTCDGAIVLNPTDSSVYIRVPGYWKRIASGTQLALDSAYMRNDTMFFPISTGVEIAVKVTGLPQANVNGLADSLGVRWDSASVKGNAILNQTSTAESKSYRISGNGYAGMLRTGYPNTLSSAIKLFASSNNTEEPVSRLVTFNYLNDAALDTIGTFVLTRSNNNTVDFSDTTHQYGYVRSGQQLGSIGFSGVSLEGSINGNRQSIGLMQARIMSKSESDFSTNSASSANLSFWTKSTTEPTISQKMYISPLGNVGIGTGSPQTKLHVNGKIIGQDATVDSNMVTYRQVNSVSVMAFGAKADGVTDDSQAFNDAISAGVKRVYIPRGTYAISKAKLRDNLEIIGEPGTVIRQLNNTEYYQNGTFEYRDTSGASRANVTIRNIEFISYPYNTNALNNAILFLVDLNTRVSNIIIDNCTFRAQQQTAIFFLNRFQDYIGIKNVMVNNCRAYGDTTLSAQSKNTNLVRTLSNFSPILGSYGKVGIENITVRGCYSEYIRTLADIKRGVRGATILGNVARNSYDVAYSSDGCFQVSIANNVADNDSLFLSKITAGGSQIEVQGEGVSITNNIITYCKANGILITDYGLPEEGGLGHNSKGVVISGNTVKFSDIAIKAVNAIGMNISGNQVDYAKTRSIAVDNGTGRVDGSGQPLKSKGVTVIGNLISNVGSIVVSSDSSAAASNFNTFGAATVDGSSTTLIKSPNTSQQILDAVKTVDGTGSGLDADLLDGVNSTGFYGAAGTFTDFNTATGNKIYTLSAITPANRPASGNYFSLLNIDQDVSGNSRAQLTFRIGTNDVLVRNQFGGTWSSWNLLYHSGNSNLSTVPWAASTVTASGAVSMPYTTISANTTLDATYRTVNTATSGITITLPSAASAFVNGSGRIYEIRNASAGNITISSVQVWGTATTTIPTVTSWRIQSDGTNWILLSRSN